jgi:hypothetical protein
MIMLKSALPFASVCKFLWCSLHDG